MSEYCNNFEFKEDNSDSFQFWQGLRGPYFTPSVDDAGNLSWTNNGGLPNPDSVNIKGQNGEDIHIGGIVETVEELPAAADDNVVWLVGTDAPYEAYIYVNGEWVDAGQFLPGGGGGVQSDWNETNPTNPAFIKNKPTIPAAQIQSDWDQTNTTAKDYIKNKPTVPAVDDTLSNTGEAADAKKTGDEISDLKNTLSYEVITNFNNFKPTSASPVVTRRYGYAVSGDSPSNTPISGSITWRGYVEGHSGYCTQHFTSEYATIASNQARTFTRVYLNGIWGSWIESEPVKFETHTLAGSYSNVILKRRNGVVYCAINFISSLDSEWQEIGTTSFTGESTLCGSMVANTGKVIKLRVLTNGSVQAYALGGAITSSTYIQDSCVLLSLSTTDM